MLIILFSFSITALAQTTTQDGLQVNLTTDKQSYSLNEDIQITISVTNTNDFTVKDVSIEALLPDKFELKDSNDETSTKAIDLKSGEQASQYKSTILKEYHRISKSVCCLKFNICYYRGFLYCPHNLGLFIFPWWALFFLKNM